MKPQAIGIGIIVAIGSFIADQYSKSLILNYFLDKTRKLVEITDFLNFCLIWNKGVSFGLFSNYENPRLPLLLAAGLIVIFLLIMLCKAKHYYQTVSLGLIIGGALGNIWDRYQYGAVVDFIEVYYKKYYWPAFNLADSVVLIGLVLLLFEKKVVKNEK